MQSPQSEKKKMMLYPIDILHSAMYWDLVRDLDFLRKEDVLIRKASSPDIFPECWSFVTPRTFFCYIPLLECVCVFFWWFRRSRYAVWQKAIRGLLTSVYLDLYKISDVAQWICMNISWKWLSLFMISISFIYSHFDNSEDYLDWQVINRPKSWQGERNTKIMHLSEYAGIPVRNLSTRRTIKDEGCNGRGTT